MRRYRCRSGWHNSGGASDPVRPSRFPRRTPRRTRAEAPAFPRSPRRSCEWRARFLGTADAKAAAEAGRAARPAREFPRDTARSAAEAKNRPAVPRRARWRAPHSEARRAGSSLLARASRACRPRRRAPPRPPMKYPSHAAACRALPQTPAAGRRPRPCGTGRYPSARTAPARRRHATQAPPPRSTARRRTPQQSPRPPGRMRAVWSRNRPETRASSIRRSGRTRPRRSFSASACRPGRCFPRRTAPRTPCLPRSARRRQSRPRPPPTHERLRAASIPRRVQSSALPRSGPRTAGRSETERAPWPSQAASRPAARPAPAEAAAHCVPAPAQGDRSSALLARRSRRPRAEVRCPPAQRRRRRPSARPAAEALRPPPRPATSAPSAFWTQRALPPRRCPISQCAG